MKKLRIIILGILLVSGVQSGQAQFLKKLKKAVLGNEEAKPTEKTSDLDQKFDDWDQGAADIIAISVFSDDFNKYRQIVGKIQPDGSFSFKMPDSLKTWVPIGVYGSDCENSEEAVVENPEVKLAGNQMHIFKNGEYLGAISPANPVAAAYNVNQSGVNNGNLGKYYLWIYADGDALATIDCTKISTVTDGKETIYPKMPLEDTFDLHYKKGWNIVEVDVLDNIWAGLTKQYLERTWKVVEELPKDVSWVFRPRIQEP